MTLITDDMKTEWFPPSMKPVYEGVYETYWLSPGSGEIVYVGWARWIEGVGWANSNAQFRIAAARQIGSPVQYKYWRGLTDEGRSYASAMGLYGDGQTS